VKIPRERALARGVNKKRFSGTAEAGALPKSSRAFARLGRVRDPSLHNHLRPVPTRARLRATRAVPPRVGLRSLSRVGSERPISHFSQKRREMGHPGCTPARCFREKHAEPKPQEVIVSSLQDSVVAYL